MSQVQNALFKVHQSVLSDKSLIFKDMFNVDKDCGVGVPQTEGSSDDHPILLEGLITEVGFELFLSVCYNKWRPDASQLPEDTIMDLLKLSKLYASKAARHHAIAQLNFHCYSMQPATLISVTLKYHIKDVFHYAFTKLISKHVNDFEVSDYALLTHPVWIALLKVKERLDQHRHIVACELPTLTHSTCCPV
ncbi:hypothetical protein SCLCIDRAFT_27079 [Scleroderma citrinum Foug A]|uniref:BTB domain-containing protein n=1 Tax=Scleroderma citrinum Foug A TaxID=1036808 RepID=A0A0C3DV64_9AGAM|nr:hypothetical protein SCLCIDRAFT_27079 [Scleroderma citrinum Foug A]